MLEMFTRIFDSVEQRERQNYLSTKIIERYMTECEMSVEELKREFKDEWVLVEIVEEDELERPLKVKLITHSKNRDEIYEALKENKGYTYHFYTGDIPKKGYAVAFHGGTSF